MAIGCGGKDTQSSGPSPGALFRRAIKFGSDIGRPVPVVDNDDNDDVTDFRAQTSPRSLSLNDTAILGFQFDADVFHHAGQSFVSDLLSVINSGLVLLEKSYNCTYYDRSS